MRRLLKLHRVEVNKLNQEWVAVGYRDLPPEYPHLPEACTGMMCGAKTRKGTPCKQKAVYLNGRCKFHGGLSTGPRTAEGKRTSAKNGCKPKSRPSKCDSKQTPCEVDKT